MIQPAFRAALLSIPMLEPRIAILYPSSDVFRATGSARGRRFAPHPAPTLVAIEPPAQWAAALKLASPAELDLVRRAAVHEAGHCVGLVLSGAHLAGVGLHFEVVGGRFVFLGGGVFQEDLERPMSELTLAAGWAAVLEAGFEDPYGREYARAGSDMKKLYSLFPPINLRNVMRTTRSALRNNWSAVESVAQALLEDGKVRGSRAELLVIAGLTEWERKRLGYAAPVSA